MMNSISVETGSEILTRNARSQVRTIPVQMPFRDHHNSLYGYVKAEGGDSFFNYLHNNGLDRDPNFLVLSSKHHYFYDIDELKGITTLINLKRLNHMRHLESFIHVLSDILSSDTRFIGCFADKRNRNGNYRMPGKLYKKLISFLDDRTDIDLDRSRIEKLFGSCGFRVTDMTEIDGLTYFTTRKAANQLLNPSQYGLVS